MYWIWERPYQPVHQRLRVETFFFTLSKWQRIRLSGLIRRGGKPKISGFLTPGAA